jgi:hypothetical protein
MNSRTILRTPTSFEEFFNLGFGKPIELRFERNGILDMSPAIWDKDEDGNYTATVNTLGLTEVKLEQYEFGIRVSGENELRGKTYKTTMKLPIAERVMNDIVKIKHKTIAGLTFITLVLEPAKQISFEIEED